MAYTLYLDKTELFECDVSVKNASMNDAFVRIIVEAGDVSLMFPGRIKDGKCQVPIKKLKGLLQENAKGNIHLEMVVEDTYFKPWTDTFDVEQHTNVKVKIHEQKKPSKPLVEVKSVKNNTNVSDPVHDLVFIFERVGITKNNASKNKQNLKKVINEYFKANPEHQVNIKKVISEAVLALK